MIDYLLKIERLMDQLLYNSMNKIFTILTILLVAASCQTNKQILQQVLGGLYQQNRLHSPTTIIPCIDDITAQMIVQFIGEMINRLAKGSLSDYIYCKDQIKNFHNTLPQQVKDCLFGNKEIKTLQLKYGIDETTDPDAVENKITSYWTLHYLTVHKWAISLNDQWKSFMYYKAGYDFGGYAHPMLGLSPEQIRRLVKLV